MDEIALLRRSRTDVPDRTPQQVALAREELVTRFEAAIADTSPRSAQRAPSYGAASDRRHRAGFPRLAGLSAIAATAVAGVVVVASVVGIGPGEHGGANAAAANALTAAAAATLEVVDPVVAPGQYLLIRTDATFAAYGASPTGDGGTALLTAARSELLVPADRSDDWTLIQCAPSPLQTFGHASEALAAIIVEDWKDVAVDKLRELPGGYFESGSPLVEDLAALPRDPQELLNLAYARTEHSGPSADDAAFGWIAETLWAGVVPADLRAALYQAAIGIPGITITEDQATLNGSVGIAIGRDEATGTIRRDIVIDPTNGMFIGERQVMLTPGNDMPAGTAVTSTALSTTVVDAVPTLTSVCADVG